jgi:hypothetical protein
MEYLMNERLWLTWETQRRNAELADAFSCHYGHLDFSSSGPLFRYLRSICATLVLFYARQFSSRKKNSVVFVQCPSVVLVALLSVLRYLHSFVFVIDAHNITFEYLNSSNTLLRLLTRFSLKRADRIIVSNFFLTKDFSEFEAKFLSLPDKLPKLHFDGRAQLPESFTSRRRPWVLLVATFAADEPIDFFLESVSSIAGQECTIFVSGKRSKAAAALRHESDCVVFTDFLPSHTFDLLLSQCDLVVDLTTRDNCLVCGAYEAVAAQVPALLSDSLATRDIFSKGCLYAVNTTESYRTALGKFLEDPHSLKNGVVEMSALFELRWRADFERVVSSLAIDKID